MSETADVAEELRGSDADREHAVSELKRHCGDGRLTLDELEERIAEVYAASTKAEIEHALRELPKARTVVPVVHGPPVRTSPSTAPVRTTVGHGAEVALKVHLYTYLCVIALLVVIYMLTTPGGYFWPVWPALGWGTAVALQAGVTKAITTGRS
jgi:hypothetical protein